MPSRPVRTRLLAALAGAVALSPVALLPASAATPSPGQQQTSAPSVPAVPCHPTGGDRPVCPARGPAEAVSFLDPTARLTSPAEVELEGKVYVGPFAELLALPDAPITIGEESNVQDNVVVVARSPRDDAGRQALARVGLTATSGVETGERVILAHGSSVRGPARLGVLAAGQQAPAKDSGVFISFGARVDGAVLERDSGVSALGRVGPGVRLPSGTIVLPGKDVTTQAQADDPALGFVRPITEADRLFNAGVVEVNVGLAREYTRLAREDGSAVRGISVDPGGNEFDESRDLPHTSGALCTGPEAKAPGFRNRIIGDACFENSLAGLSEVMGSRISIRADEGGPFGLGTIRKMGDGTVFHALEGSDLRVGNRVTYGRGAIVHGGGRPAVDPTTGLAAPTLVGNDVRLGDGAVVFRSLLGNGARVGGKSLVVGSELKPGQVVGDRTIYANDAVFGRVTW